MKRSKEPQTARWIRLLGHGGTSGRIWAARDLNVVEGASLCSGRPRPGGDMKTMRNKWQTGLLAGLLAAAFASRRLVAVLDGLTPLDPWSFAAASVILVAVATKQPSAVTVGS